MDYAKLVPLLIEAIKEQNKKVENQAQKMIDLQKQIEELKKISYWLVSAPTETFLLK